MVIKVEEKEVIQQIIRGLRLSPGAEKIPNEINERIRVVYVANPQIEATDVIHETLTSTGTVQVFRTPPSKDFFLTLAHLNFTNLVDPTAFAVECRLIVQFNNLSLALIELFQPPKLLSNGQSVTMAFPVPIKLDRDTGITVEIIAGTASSKAKATIVGYTVEP